MIKSFLLCIIILMFLSCRNTHQTSNYTRDKEGCYYKLLAIGDGNNYPLRESVLVIEAVMKTQSDSVFWDTKHDALNGMYISLGDLSEKDPCKKYFMKMVEGDSSSFLIKPTILFRDYFDTIVPDFCQKDSLLKLDVKLIQIISRAEYQALQKNAEGKEQEEDKELEELQLIDCYLLNKYKYVKADETGVYIINKTTTNLEPVSEGKKIKVSISGEFLDGKPIDNKAQALEFTYGMPDQVVKGLNIIIGRLKKGETAKIILPSRLAFGELGSSNGSIPPYTPLVYNIKIIDIK